MVCNFLYRYYKQILNGYILCVGKNIGGEEITESEYNEILQVIGNKPQKTDTADYRLKEDLTWEEYEVEPPDQDPELDDSEALDILLGGTP